MSIADIKIEQAKSSQCELTLTYREIYDMSDKSIHEVLVGPVRVSDGTLEEVGNEFDRRVTDGTYTYNPNPFGWTHKS